MKIGIIGLGRMGGNIARRLMRHDHEVVVYDRGAETVAKLAGEGAEPAGSLGEMCGKLGPDPIYWVMLPAGEPTESTIATLAETCGEGGTLR